MTYKYNQQMYRIQADFKHSLRQRIDQNIILGPNVNTRFHVSQVNLETLTAMGELFGACFIE